MAVGLMVGLLIFVAWTPPQVPARVSPDRRALDWAEPVFNFAHVSRTAAVSPEVPDRATVVALPGGGRIYLGDERISLAGLSSVRGEVVVRADEDVCWLHIQLVLAALNSRRVKRVHFRVAGGFLGATLHSSFWSQDIEGVPGGHRAGLVPVTLWRDEGILMYEEERDLRSLADRIREVRRRTRLRPLGVIHAQFDMPFRLIARTLAAFHEAGLHDVEFVGLPIQDRNIFTLPPSEPGWLIYPERLCACRNECLPLPLPVADMAEEDQNNDPDDRVILNLDERGRLYSTREMRWGELESHLRKAARVYDEKMKERGKRGIEEVSPDVYASKLYVLLRAHKDVPWIRVATLLEVLATMHFYKLQFGVKKYAEREWSCACLRGKLAAFLPTDNWPSLVGKRGPDDFRIRVEILPGGLYRYRGGTIDDLEVLGKWVREEHAGVYHKNVRVLGVILPEPSVRHERVIAVVNLFARAGIEKLDFAE